MSGRLATRVLVVEDEALQARVIECLLGAHGLMVDLAAHGGEAMEKLRLTSFDLVVTDLMMPEVDGEQLVRWMREAAAPDVPVIVLSAIRDTRQAARLASLGVRDILQKPLDLDVLVERVLALAGGDA